VVWGSIRLQSRCVTVAINARTNGVRVRCFTTRDRGAYVQGRETETHCVLHVRVAAETGLRSESRVLATCFLYGSTLKQSEDRGILPLWLNVIKRFYKLIIRSTDSANEIGWCGSYTACCQVPESQYVWRQRAHVNIYTSIMFYLQIAGWLACSVYATIPAFWLMIHPFTAYWHARRSAYKVLTPLWVMMWIIAAALTGPWRNTLLYDAPLTRLFAIPFWCATLYIYFGGQRHFSVNKVIGRHELEPDRHSQRLVTTGLHGRMRHPLYAGHLCTMLGWCFLTSTVATWTLLAFAAFSGIFLLRTEDAELERRFGNDYREYKQRVPAIFPKLSRK